ncbi:MAG: hypothetical protein K9L59_06930 [Desulfobacterales bacterium]|nr:hypothetical protein [Desulfobacterales bacterium]
MKIPNATYRDVVPNHLAYTGENPMMADFLPFADRISRFGVCNSLSQTLIKITVPGVPDFYQGTEMFDFSLVDPDNRRAVCRPCGGLCPDPWRAV